VLNLDLTQYYRLDNSAKQNVLQDIRNGYFSSLEELRSLFAVAVQKTLTSPGGGPNPYSVGFPARDDLEYFISDAYFIDENTIEAKFTILGEYGDLSPGISFVSVISLYDK
jgi:hypothetical protein